MSTRGRVIAAALVVAVTRPVAAQVPPPQPPAPGTDNATAPQPPGQIAPVGPRYSIELVVVGGDNPAYDNMHARYPAGRDVQLQAVVRDSTGQIIENPENAVPPCTPTPSISDNVTPDGKLRGQITGGPGNWGVHFAEGGGVFHVAMQCREDLSITSDRTQAHLLNFENSTPILQAPQQFPPPPAFPPPQKAQARHHGNGAIVLGAVLAGLVIAGVVIAASAASSGAGGGGTTYCVVIASSTNGSCPPGNYPYTTQADCLNGPMGYAYLQSFCTCRVATCGVTFAPNPCSPCPGAREAGPIRDVHDLVARGLAMPRGSATSSIARTAAAPARAATTATAARSGAHWLLPAAAGALSLASLSYAWWRAARSESPHVDVVPWATPGGGGVAIGGRF